MPFIRHKFNTMENVDIHLEGYNTFPLRVELTSVMQPVVKIPKMWYLTYMVSKLSSDVFNICIVTHINPYFILMNIIMDQISSDLHGVGIKLKTTHF